MRNLILCGGIFHAFEESSNALARELASIGVQSSIECDLHKGIEYLADTRFDLLTVNALRWEMIGEKYDPYREQEAFHITERQRTLIRSHVERGGALLALHTASICFSDWPEWSNILGGAWEWGQSWHPAPCAISVSATASSLFQPAAFEVVDELYTDLKLSRAVDVELVGQCDAVDTPQPVMWRHAYGKGRVVYDSLGHDARSLSQLSHAEVLRSAVAWSLENRSPG